MTTQYINPQIIFASDAPTKDKPPAFNNYAKGMDETRSNDGRPTIKQLNFIQQQNDFKFLYIHERGACLPFVDGFPYENNAIVFKDGFIQQKNGSSWVIPFMRGSQNLAELTDVAQARNKLDVYSKGEALSKENNLLDVSNKGVARANLGVYSKAETDAIAGTPNATETTAGKARIATLEIAQAGVNDTDILTPKKLRDALNASGTAPISACRAWVCFNGSTLEILNSLNILSITKIATGRFRLTFKVSMPTANFLVVGSNKQASTSSYGSVVVVDSSDTGVASEVIISTKTGGSADHYEYTKTTVGVFC